MMPTRMLVKREDFQAMLQAYYGKENVRPFFQGWLVWTRETGWYFRE